MTRNYSFYRIEYSHFLQKHIRVPEEVYVEDNFDAIFLIIVKNLPETFAPCLYDDIVVSSLFGGV